MDDRILVYIVLGGGNDGLNTVIPLDTTNNNLYYSLRPTIALSNPVQLDGALDLAVHPSATALKDMYQAGKAAIIQNVHYPNHNKSHFKGTDIKFSAKDGNTQADTGNSFIGEWINSKYPNYPAGYPNVDMEDALGLGLGFALPGISFNRASGNQIGLKLVGSPTTFRQLVTSVNQPSTNPLGLTASKRKIAKWYAIDQAADAYSLAMANAYAAQNNVLTYGTGKLANQLKDIARLIGGGSNTQIYIASIGGFDTHSSQVESANTATGAHANLMDDLFTSVKEFIDDLNAMGSSIADRVLVQTFTEFGRQVRENGSFGTDHGTSSPVFVFGNGVNPGVYGNHPDLSNLNINDYAVTYQYDYRQLLATTFYDWLGAGTVQLTAAGLNGFTRLNFISDVFTGTRDALYNA